MRILFLTMVIGLLALQGCAAHKELKAPCNDKVAAFGTVPCDDRQPVNVAGRTDLLEPGTS